jgi:hypothetical protein
MSEKETKTETDVPVHDSIDVLKADTIYKYTEWWKAVVWCESFGDQYVAVYQWQYDDEDDRWKRNQKMKIGDTDEWEEIKEAVEQHYVV